MEECFVPREFKPPSLLIIDAANIIIAEYQAAGFTLTLRQLYYQFVARDLIPNRQSEYKRLGSIINDGRLAGLIDWDAIEDRTRQLRDYDTFANPARATHELARRYIENLWEKQPFYVEVWEEKDALLGVIEPACQRWRVPYFSCRGYPSQSELYGAGQRIEEQYFADKETVILHLGDHDPSGLDMTRDIEARLTMFSKGAPLEVRRLALNMEQIDRYRPPPNPAKETDSRCAPYVIRYGTRSSWELDALDPQVIDKLIDSAIAGLIDGAAWEEATGREEANRERLFSAANSMETK